MVRAFTSLVACTCCMGIEPGSLQGVARGTLTVGDAVLFIAMVQQLSAPLNYFGSFYRWLPAHRFPGSPVCAAHPADIACRQIQTYMIDTENLFDLLGSVPSVRVRSGHLSTESCH